MLCAPAAFADGYLFTLKEEVAVPFSVDSSVERVPVTDEIMYKADTIDEIYDFVSEDNVIDIIYNCEIELFDAPNDPYYSYQWNLSNTRALYAYEKGLRGEGVKIGIIDSGINYGHEDIDSSKIVNRYNVFDDSDDVADEYGHGSFVSGIIGADTNNGIGVAGIADQAGIAMYKIFNGKTTTLDKLLVGFDKAIADGCDVINMSLGVAQKDINQAIINQFQSMVNKAVKKDIIIVAAVGNNYDSTINYPAACENVIGVGSVGKTNNHSSFSNYNESVFVVAPGESLASTWYGASNSYKLAGSGSSGTSFSAPLVTAMAALAKQINKNITVSEIMEILRETSTDLGDTGYDTYYGYGLVNIEKFADELIWRYKKNIQLSEDEKSVTFYGLAHDVTLYTAGYSDGKLESISDETISGTGEITLDLPDNCDTVRLFFWQDMMPVWNTIDIEQN